MNKIKVKGYTRLVYDSKRQKLVKKSLRVKKSHLVLIAILVASTVVYWQYRLLMNEIRPQEALGVKIEAKSIYTPKTEKNASEARILPNKSIEKRNIEQYIKNIKVTIKKLENSVAYKSNNPGNLVYAGQPNAKPMKFAGKIFASYSTPELGFRGLIKQIEADQKRELTLAKFVNKYAPAHENDTPKYIEFAVNKMNANKNTIISNMDSIELAKTMAEFESQTIVVEN